MSSNSKNATPSATATTTALGGSRMASRNSARPHRSRTQYHYVYGSIPDNSSDDNNDDDDDDDEQNGDNEHDDDKMLSLEDPSFLDAALTSDQDSLIGESLIPTDNEDEGAVRTSSRRNRLGSESDFQHLLMTHGGRTTSLQRLHLAGGSNGNGATNRQRALSQRNNHHHHHRHSSNNGTSKRSMAFAWNIKSLRQSHPMIFGLFVATTAVLLIGLAAVILFPDSSVAQLATMARAGENAPYHVPFPRVHRVDYDDNNVESFIRLDLMDPTWVKKDARSTLTFAFPTGAFWTNLVLLGTASTADHGISYPVAVYPYAYKWSDVELQLSYPVRHRRVTPTEMDDYFFPDLRLSTVETISRRYIQAFDSLSVTLRYEMENKGSMTAYLVQGSPYMTVAFQGVAPILTAFTTLAAVTCPKDADLAALGVVDAEDMSNPNDGHGGGSTSKNGSHRRHLRYGVCTQQEQSSSGTTTTLHGVQFILQSQEGMVWYVFASEPLTWKFDVQSRQQLVATTAFTGVLRVALVPTNTLLPTTSDSSSSSSSSSSNILDSSQSYLKSTGLARLIYHAGVYPTGGSVSWSFGSANNNNNNNNAASEAVSLATKTVTGLAAAITGDMMGSSNRTNSTLSSASMSSSSSSSSSLSSSPTTASTPSSSNQDSASSNGSSSLDRFATLSFKFSTQSFTKLSSATPQKSLLMLALPHHARSLSSSTLLNQDSFDLVFKCIKGSLQPVLGSSWSYNIPLPGFGLDGDSGSIWDGSSSITKVLQHPVVRDTILANLEADVDLALPTTAENIYGFGKQAARLAQLVHISNTLYEMQQQDDATSSSTTSSSPSNATNATQTSGETRWTDSQDDALQAVIQKAKRHLKESLELLLSGNVSDILVFDQDLGGLVSIDGLRNTQADFGNGRYNDHHFHYGYLLYACAILASVDQSFLRDYGKKVDAVMYDVAYEGNFASTHTRTNGPFFPGARHKSWFDGHSFASGLFPYGNGKSQESSSEAVNCYYGAYVWSLARNGAIRNPEEDTSAQTDFMRLLLATEIRGAKTYWQMLPPTSTNSNAPSRNSTSVNKTASVITASTPLQLLPQQGVYSAEFATNYMVGNLGMLDVNCRTWFGTQLLYVHMINFLPVTAATGELFAKTYASREYQAVLKSQEAEPSWIGYKIANQAISEPNNAWVEALDVVSPTLDPGLSKSQLLYWITTRKGFSTYGLASPSSPATVQGASPTISTSSSSLETCSTNPKCAALGLKGSCCPAPSGTFLDCCEQ